VFEELTYVLSILAISGIISYVIWYLYENSKERKFLQELEKKWLK